jgi:hypothetical protein
VALSFRALASGLDHPANPISPFPIGRGSVQGSHSGLFLPDFIGAAHPFGGDSFGLGLFRGTPFVLCFA